MIRCKPSISGAIFLLTVSLFPGYSLAQWKLNPKESAKVESYLREIQTESLLVEHLETEVARETNIQARYKLASRLLTLYAQNMMSGKKVVGVNWLEKTEQLLTTYPNLETPTIRISVLQAQYAKNEKDFQTWWKDGQDVNKKSQLIQKWQELESQLSSITRILEMSYQSQIANAQSQNQSPDSQELLQTEGLLLHTNYLFGWTSYFNGILVPEERKRLMKQADTQFREFLQINPDKALSTLDPTWFDFSSRWQVRSFVGLSMVQRGLNYPNQAKFCFEMIESQANSKLDQDMRSIWELRSYLYLDQYDKALDLVHSFSENKTNSRESRIAFWNAALDAGTGLSSVTTKTSSQFIESGLTGLTREFESRSINRFLEANNLDLKTLLGESKNFENSWIKGYRQFFKAEMEGGLENYRQARIALTSALNLQANLPLDKERCRFLVARIDHRLQDYSSAASSFLQVSKNFDQVDRQLAAESQWLATRSLVELSKRNPREKIRASEALDSIVRRFPGSTYATRAEFESIRVNLASMNSLEAIKLLNGIESNSLNYPVALNEIVKLRYKTWLLSHKSKSSSVTSELQELVQAESNYRILPNASDLSKLKSNLLVVDALLRNPSVDKNQIQNRLDFAKGLASNSGASQSAYHEYRYYKFLFANSQGDTDLADEEAKWLAANANGSRFQKSALVQLAQTTDRKYRETNQPSKQQTDQLVGIFERLVSVLGKSPKILASTPNARIAVARLAELKIQTKQTKEAIELLGLLLQSSPNNKAYLQQLAVAYSNTKDFKSAVLVWRKLANGAQAGTELWFEAKFQLATSLFESGDLAAAKLLHTQTIRLSPNIPDHWKSSFDQLSEKLK